MKHLILMLMMAGVVSAGDLGVEFSTQPSTGTAGMPLTANLLIPNSGCSFLDLNESDVVHVVDQTVHVFVHFQSACVDPYPVGQFEEHSVVLSNLSAGDYNINYYVWDADMPDPDLNNLPQSNWTFSFQMGPAPMAVNATNGLGLALLLVFFLFAVVRHRKSTTSV